MPRVVACARARGRSAAARNDSPSGRRARRRGARDRRASSGSSGSPAHPHSTVRSFSSSLNVTPWSTPYVAGSASAWTRPCNTWPPLRSALLTTASNTHIRRRSGSSACTRVTGCPPHRARRAPRASRRGPAAVDHVDSPPRAPCRRRRAPSPRPAPSPARTVRPHATPWVGRGPSPAPPRPRRRPPRADRACRRGSPTADAPPRWACRRRPPRRRRGRRAPAAWRWTRRPDGPRRSTCHGRGPRAGPSVVSTSSPARTQRR